jgi:hypothetical protein
MHLAAGHVEIDIIQRALPKKLLVMPRARTPARPHKRGRVR